MSRCVVWPEVCNDVHKNMENLSPDIYKWTTLALLLSLSEGKCQIGFENASPVFLRMRDGCSVRDFLLTQNTAIYSLRLEQPATTLPIRGGGGCLTCAPQLVTGFSTLNVVEMAKLRRG